VLTPSIKSEKSTDREQAIGGSIDQGYEAVNAGARVYQQGT